EEGIFELGTIDLIDLNNIDNNILSFGEVQEQCGKASFEYVEHAIDLALKNSVDGIATTPINKESLKQARVPYIGHTEMLEELTNRHDPLTMFQVKEMKIFFLTRHLSLKNAINQITKDRIVDYIERCDE